MLPLSCHADVSRNPFCKLLDVVKAFCDVVKLPAQLLHVQQWGQTRYRHGIYVGANLFARKWLIMRINSHLQVGQPQFQG